MQPGQSYPGTILLFLLPILLITACGRKNDQPSPEEQVSPQRSAAEQLRASRAEPREPAPEPEPVPEPKPTPTESFAERLRVIVGDTYATNKELQERAEAGDATAQYQLGRSLWESGDYAEALKWYQLAAAQGNAKAQQSLGVMYVRGDGVQRDMAEAVRWYKLAADQGEADAQYSLGLRYVIGDAVEKDFAEAAKWFSLAAEQGVTDAQLSLARRYAAGEGVGQDLTEAYKWCLITEKYGTYQRYGAKQLRESITDNMTDAQIADAQARADVFKPKK